MEPLLLANRITTVVAGVAVAVLASAELRLWMANVEERTVSPVGGKVSAQVNDIQLEIGPTRVPLGDHVNISAQISGRSYGPGTPVGYYRFEVSGLDVQVSPPGPASVQIVQGSTMKFTVAPLSAGRKTVTVSWRYVLPDGMLPLSPQFGTHAIRPPKDEPIAPTFRQQFELEVSDRNGVGKIMDYISKLSAAIGLPALLAAVLTWYLSRKKGSRARVRVRRS